MSRSCKTERAAAQQRLLGASLMELMEEGEYASVTVMDLCRRAGIPRRTFYYHYESKEDVLTGLLDELLEECDLETMFTRQQDRSSLERGFVRFFCYWRDRRRRELTALLRNNLRQLLLERVMKRTARGIQWQELILERQEHRGIIGSALGLTCVYYTLFYWHSLGFGPAPEEMAAHVTTLLTEPMYALP